MKESDLLRAVVVDIVYSKLWTIYAFRVLPWCSVF